MLSGKSRKNNRADWRPWEPLDGQCLWCPQPRSSKLLQKLAGVVVYVLGDQTKAFEKLKDFIRDKDAKVFILRGYAGTGKTTMMKVLIEELSSMNFSNQLLASTGRAAKILSDKKIGRAHV